MKVETLDKSVVSVGGERSSFSIARSSKMFNLLLAGLYSNIHQSITREIMANAYDAHADAGTDKAIDVIFPTILNPEFRVRDYGLGLSHDFVMNKYTIVGHSEKEGTNDQVGYWGIGRLSPFAYTTQYTVISVHNSTGKPVKSTYLVSMNSSKEPEVTFFGSEETTEPTGLQVSFPIKSGDVGLFKDAFKDVLLGYKVLPNVINSNEFDPSHYTPIESGDGFTVYNRNVFRGVRARMGCITYPIDINLVPGSTYELAEFGSIVLEFDIGDLAITASRENLSYGSDEPTIKAISEKAESVLKTLLAKFISTLDSKPNIFEARKYYESIKDNLLERPIARQVLNSSKYKDNIFESEFIDSGYIKLGKIDFIEKKTQIDTDWSPVKEFYRWRTHYDKAFTLSLKDPRDRVIVLDAKSSYLHKRLVNYTESNHTYANYYLIDKDEVEILNIIKQYVDDQTKIINISELPVFKPAKGARRDKFNVYTYSSRYGSLIDYVLVGDVFDKGGVYVPVTHKEIKPESDAKLQNTLPEDYVKLYKKFKLIDSNLDTKPLVFVPATNASAFKKADNWKTFEDYYSTWYDTDTKTKLEYIDEVLCNEVVQSVSKESYQIFKDFPESDGLTSKHDPVFKGISINYTSSLVHQLLNFNKKDTIENKYKSIVRDYLLSKKKEYPLLGLLDSVTSNSDRQVITDSILKEVSLNSQLKDFKEFKERFKFKTN